ncbi:MAG: CoA transferase [Nevskiaceae bacterium]|nr:MAG: CoA transferase [Nevskiaceae bacterium]TBR71952.1 MAG: CoA transferase [Nevskiaceae bacterium]
MAGPLHGIRIVEMAGLGPAPFCAMLLSDMGAEIIRIEQKPDSKRAPLRLFPDPKFDVMARGRRSLAIDLKAPGATAAVLDLVAQADALIEGFRPGVMEKLGLGPDACLARKPGLVYGRMTGWGQTGPLANAVGHDLNYIAITGALGAIGPKEQPSIPLNLVGDFGGGGLLLAFGIACALTEAQRSGKGQVVDTAMSDGAALLTSMMYGLRAAKLWNNARESNLLDGAAPFYGTYACADGKFVALGAIEPRFYNDFLARAGITDPAFKAQMNLRAWPELKEKLAALFKTRTRAEWCALLEGTDACFAPVLDWDEAPQHPHNRARNTFIDIAGVTQPAPAPRFSRTACDTPAPPRKTGADTLDILKDWGIDGTRIEKLRADGAI